MNAMLPGMKKSKYTDIIAVGKSVRLIGINDTIIEGVIVDVVGPMGDPNGVPDLHEFTMNCGDKGERTFNLNLLDDEWMLEVLTPRNF